MSRSIVLKSFAELANVLDVDALPDAATVVEAEEAAPSVPAEPAADLAVLLAELEAASSTLVTVARQDQEARALALRDLAQYDALVAEQGQAEQAHERARRVRREAEALAADAFALERFAIILRQEARSRSARTSPARPVQSPPAARRRSPDRARLASGRRFGVRRL